MVGIREIVGSVVTGFLIIYMLYFVIPSLRTSYNVELSVINQTSPLMQTILPITNNWWLFFPALIVIVGGYTIWSYYTAQNAFDY